MEDYWLLQGEINQIITQEEEESSGSTGNMGHFHTSNLFSHMFNCDGQLTMQVPKKKKKRVDHWYVIYF